MYGIGFDEFGPAYPEVSAYPEARAHKYKVGDNVRVVRLGTEPSGSGHGASVRFVDRVRNIEDDCVFGMSGWLYFPHEIEPAPLLTPGTRVRLKRNSHRFAVGDTGTVTVANDDNVGVRMENGKYWSFRQRDLEVVAANAARQDKLQQDNEPEYGYWVRGGKHIVGEKPDGWPAPSPQPHIVAVVENGKPRPSYAPHVHDDSASAIAEAERLARVNPGKRFDVYRRVTGRLAEQHVELKEVA